MEEKKKKPRNTFVATVRVSMTDIAAIGLVIEKDNYNMETLGRLASEGLRIMGSIAKMKYPIETYEKAIGELRRMGYNNPLEIGTRYYKSIHDELGKEIAGVKKQKNAMDIIAAKMKEDKEQAVHEPSEEERDKIMSQCGEPESEPAGAPVEPTSNPAPEPRSMESHAKNWRSEVEEQRDLQRIKEGFAGAPPVASE